MRNDGRAARGGVRARVVLLGHRSLVEAAVLATEVGPPLGAPLHGELDGPPVYPVPPKDAGVDADPAAPARHGAWPTDPTHMVDQVRGEQTARLKGMQRGRRWLRRRRS